MCVCVSLPPSLCRRRPSGIAVFVVCRRGNNSQLAVLKLRHILKDQDVVIKDIAGGLTAWAEQVDSQFPIYWTSTLLNWPISSYCVRFYLSSHDSSCLSLKRRASSAPTARAVKFLPALLSDCWCRPSLFEATREIRNHRRRHAGRAGPTKTDANVRHSSRADPLVRVERVIKWKTSWFSDNWPPSRCWGPLMRP